MPIPLNLPFGNYVLTGNRGEAGKKLLPEQAKDAQAYVNAGPETKAPTRPDTRMPRIKLERATDFTRFATSESIHRQIEKLTPLNSADEIARAVVPHIASNLPPPGTATKPILVLVGEHHDSRASLMTNIAALAAATRDGRKPLVLMELKSRDLPLVEHASRAIRQDLSVGAAMGTDKSMFVADMLNKPYVPNGPNMQNVPNVPLNVGSMTHCAILHLLALEAGGEVCSFDLTPQKGPTIVDRQADMAQVIRGALDLSQGEPVFVVTGSSHVAPLHHALQSETHMVALTTVGEPDADNLTQTPHERKQLSYLHANADKILLLRPSTDLIAGSFDFDAYARSLSMQHRKPLPVLPGGGRA